LLVAAPLIAQPGNLDPGFNPGANDQVYALAALPDGKLLVGGRFWGISGGLSRLCGALARGRQPGSGIQLALSALSTGHVSALAVAGDGRMLVAGQLQAPGGVAGHSLFRLLPDGRLDPTFLADSDQLWSASGLAVYPDGRVLVTAWQSGYPGVLRFTAEGDLDTSFNPGIGGGGLAALVLPNNHAIVGGTFGVVRLNTAGQVDRSFYAKVDGTVAALARQADGLLVIAGDFATVGGARRIGVARLQADGQLDPAFDPGDGPNGWISALALEPDGKVLIGGGFTRVAGTVRNFLARLRSDGRVDPDFDPGTSADHEIRAIARDAQGRTVIGGLFTHFEGQTRWHLARLTADGSLNPGFLEVTASRLTVPEDAGSVAIGLRRFSGQSGLVSVRVSAVSEQATAGEDYVFDPVVVTLAEGQTNATVTVPLAIDTGVEETESFRVVLDEPTGGALLGESHETRVFIQNDDTGVTMDVADLTANELSDTARIFVLRVGAVGSAFTVDYVVEADTATAGEDFVAAQGTVEFSPTATVAVINVNLQDDDLAEGEESFLVRLSHPSPPTSLLEPTSTRVRLRDNEVAGGLEKGFAPLLSGAVLGLTQQSDGALIVLTNGAVRPLRLWPDGVIEPGYASGASNVAAVLLADGADRLVFTTTNRYARTNGLARLLLDGRPDTSFRASAGADGYILTLLESTGHGLLVGGSFTRFNGQSRRSLARLLEDGEVETDFDARLAGGTASVYALARQPDDRILIGGQFSGVGGAVRRGVARLLADGALDPSYLSQPSAGTGQKVLALALQADGGVLVGGDFTSFNNQNRAHLVRLDPAGNLDAAFGRTGPLLTGTSGGSAAIEAIRIQPDGGILVRGNFTRVLDVTRPGLARLRPDGQLDQSFDPGAITRGSGPGDLAALELTAEGLVVIGGQFTAVNGVPRTHLARLFSAAPLPGAPVIVSCAFTSAGQVAIHFRTPSPGRYALEATDDFTVWHEVGITPPITVEGEAIDPTPPRDRSFYRLSGPRP
jgi:uncharacterized delta-60 repeat protein